MEMKDVPIKETAKINEAVRKQSLDSGLDIGFQPLHIAFHEAGADSTIAGIAGARSSTWD
jgi:hypothetical protein